MNTMQRTFTTIMVMILVVVLGIVSIAPRAAHASGAAALAQQEGAKLREEVTRASGLPVKINAEPKPAPSEPEDPGRMPNLDSPTALPDPVKNPPTEEAPTREDRAWNTLMIETFEGSFPSAGWDVFDNNGASYGEYYWDDDDYLPHYGGWSAWPANGGANALDPQDYYYPNNMDSWMVYGPFDLSNCGDSDFWFYYWNKSEIDFDWFQVAASADGNNWVGWQESGDSGGWQFEDFDLRGYLGDNSVWLAFMFTSDGSIAYDGAFVDDIQLWCYQETNVKSWTMMVYLDGDNNLESAAVDDFLEMATISSTASVNVVVEMDRIGGYSTAYDNWTDTRRFVVTPGMTPTLANSVGIGERNMGSAETLLQFIRWAKAVAPANHYALVFWDHGSGWKLQEEIAPITKGVAFDDSSGGDSIDMPELRSVLNTTTGGGASPFDIVGLDACLMAMIEIDNQIRPYANIRVSSQETEPADGWPYNLILSQLVANPGMSATTLATDIVDDYYSSYGNNQTQSAVNLGAPYTALNTAVENLAIALYNNGGTYRTQIEAARNAATEFYDTTYVDLWDLADWLRMYVNDPAINAAATAAEDAAYAAVIHEHSGPSWPWAMGISIYYPTSAGLYDSRYDGTYGFLQFTANTDWDEWLHEYYDFANYPAAFSKSSPANGATNQPLTPTLNWAASAGATSYYYCMDTSDNGTCNNAWVGVGSSTSATPSLSEATTYYWQVAALNSHGTVMANTGTWWSLTTGSLPGAFNKSGPGNGATNQPLNPTLTWGASSGATSYEYCYDTSNDNACSGWTSNGSSTSKALSGLSQKTTYYWHVRALNSIGTRYSNGSSTAFWSFTTGGVPDAFTKSSPSNGTTSQPLSLTLSWAASTGAASYDYCIDTTNDNACSGWTSSGGSTSVPISGLSQGTTYYWHVRANNSFGATYSNGSTTAFWNFTTGSQPGVFNKSGPGNGATGQPLSLTLSWGPSSGASGYEYCYDTTNDSACSGWTSTGMSTSAGIGGLSVNTTYYWQVRASNSFGTRYADSSAWWSFTTGDIPGAFNKTSPSNGATNRPLSLSLTWSASANATSYEYCYDTTNDGSCSGWTNNGTAVTAAISGLSPSTTYYWHVRANNSFGSRYSNGDAWWSFTTGNLPGAFNKSGPANAAINQNLSLTLNWVAAAEATSYAYCYDTSDNGSCDGSWINNGASTSAPISGLSGNTTYYWQVRAVNSIGETYANGSAWWNFTTGDAPGAFGKVSPSDGSINLAPDSPLSWGMAANATSYAYCFDTSNDGICGGTWTSAGLNTSVDPTGIFQPGTTYYWQVRANNSFGSTYADSGSWWSFTTIPSVTLNAISKGAQDGWVLESSELSGIGGTLNSALGTFYVGDDAARRQYRGILSFDTSGLSDTGVITSVTLKVKKAGVSGSPFATLGQIAVDIKNGYFGTLGSLQLADFKASASKSAAMTIKNTPSGGWYSATLNSSYFLYIKRDGLTQFRLRFTKDDDNDAIADFLKFYSGNAGTPAYRPVLVIQYYEP